MTTAGEAAERLRRVAAGFTARAAAVPDGAWDKPAPCEGWVARDVVRHLVEWMPGVVLVPAGLPAPAGPSPDDDPLGAWLALRDALQAAVDDPATAAREFDTRRGRTTVAEAIDYFCPGDILVHTWDLARATGLDERLDPGEVHRFFEEMKPAEEAMRASSYYGPRVEVPDDADEQTRMIAFTGRTP